MGGYNKDIVIVDEDFTTRTIDEVCSIKFLERVPKLIEINVHLMDVDNDYFLAKFKNENNFSTALSKGPWVVYDHCVTVQPWIPMFNTSQPYPLNVVVWVRLPDLSRLWKYRHLNEGYPLNARNESQDVDPLENQLVQLKQESSVKKEKYRDWMVAQWKSCWKGSEIATFERLRSVGCGTIEDMVELLDHELETINGDIEEVELDVSLNQDIVALEPST
ncbi:hypothetical protein Golob_027524 [Gossypium lobatum]|uniref:DUF4283 domain-containing protein n=1 Tax=Gossypium lobatum TaxID=34289 RepID=A0A7J8NDE7_9ROSI|nr:hypothetical protein [Gossypium lobatum]